MIKKIAWILACLPFLGLSCKHESEDFVLKYWDNTVLQYESPDVFTLKEYGLFDQDDNLLPDSLFHAARKLLFQQPAILCEDSRSRYGCPSCMDLPSYFLKSKCNGRERTWGFDPYNYSLPEEIKAYATLLQEVYLKSAP